MHKVYTIQECIIDLLAASGPQYTMDICREVRDQATEDCEENQTMRETVKAAIAPMISAGLIEVEDDGSGMVYELTDRAYYVLYVAENQRTL